MERDIFEELRKELENNNLTPEEKTRLIKQAGEEYNRQADNQFRLAVAKYSLGAAIEATAMALPMGAIGVGGKVAGKVGLAALERKFGRKIVQDTLTSAIDSAVASAAFGVGRGLLEDKNILTSSIIDAVLGLGMGGVTGASMANLQKILHEINFQAYKDPKILNQVGKKNVVNEIKKYYSGYIQGTVDSHPRVGKYKFVKNGIKETINQKFDKALNVGHLKSDMKKAAYLGPEPLGHERKPGDMTLQFHRFRKNDTDYIVKELKSGELNYHIARPAASDVKNPEVANTLLGQGLLQGSGKLPPTKSISDYLEENNPAKWLNSQITTEILDTTHVAKDKIDDAINDYHAQAVEDAVPGVFKGRVYEEFSPDNYNDYKNPMTNSPKIYTLEEFENLSPEEYEGNKYEIHAQIGEIGLPTEKEVETSKTKKQKNDTKGKKGRWITKNGNHIFIEE